jgi:dihydroorotate dehydrogenase electron transfer subunit
VTAPLCHPERSEGSLRAKSLAATTLQNRALTTDLFQLTLDAPAIAATLAPGQFVHLRLPNPAHVLRRPFSVSAANPEAGTLDIVYQVVGAGTAELSGVTRGASLDVLGPLGRGWRPPVGTRHALLVGGGVGAAPLLPLAQSLPAADVVLGAQTAARLVGHADFAGRVGADHVYITTDDGSAGQPGFATDVTRDLLAAHPYDYVATCGPEPMQRLVAALARAADVPCQVSLERRMACGVGVCLSCVVTTTTGRARACAEGPVFDAAEVAW